MKLLHVTIQTSKFEDEINFYQTFAGLKIQNDMRPLGKPIVFLGETADCTCVEIIYNPEADSAGNKYLSIGFETDYVETKRDEFERQGYEPTPLLSPAPNVKFFYVNDPAGVKVQFLQYLS